MSVAQEVPVATLLCSGTWASGISSKLNKDSLVGGGVEEEHFINKTKKNREFVHLHCWKKNQRGYNFIGSAKLTLKFQFAEK